MKITQCATSSLCFGAGFNCHPPCVKAPFPMLRGWFYTGDVLTVRTKGGFPAHSDLLLKEIQACKQGGKSRCASMAVPCNVTCSALLAAHGLGEAALLVPPDEPSSALRRTWGWRGGFPYSPLAWTDCHMPGNRYKDTAKCLVYHLSWMFKWYRKALCLIPGCLMDLRGGKSMPLIREHWSVFSLPLSTNQSLQAATISFTIQMAIPSAYIF